MNSNWASENLHVIRTLMERSALYRRALTPIMFYLGFTGGAAGLVGHTVVPKEPLAFVLYWSTIGIISLSGCFLLARKQAMKDAEPFWSPPTRHVSQALFPPLFAGAVAAAFVLLAQGSPTAATLRPLLPATWMLLYGCALTSAGFFMRQGIRVLGWIFIACGTSLLILTPTVKGFLDLQAAYSHYVMAGSFGLLHLACGIYLRISKDATKIA